MKGVDVHKHKYLVLLSLFFIMGCSKSVVFYNSEPAPFSYHVVCPGGDISATVRLVSHKIIEEDDDVALWAVFHQLEEELSLNDFGETTPEYEVYIANPKRRKIRIILWDIQNNKKKHTPLYRGTLPLRNYSVKLETELYNKQEVWVEIRNLSNESMCVTPRAIWKKSKQSFEKENQK